MSEALAEAIAAEKAARDALRTTFATSYPPGHPICWAGTDAKFKQGVVLKHGIGYRAQVRQDGTGRVLWISVDDAMRGYEIRKRARHGLN